MEIDMRKYEEYQNKFESALVETFPDIASTGRVTRDQIATVKEKYAFPKNPGWILRNTVGRGLYAIRSTPQDQEEKVMAFKSQTPTISMVPAKDPNFVPFGNFNDLESIIKSAIFYPAFVTGPTGNGKSTMIEQICAKHNRNLIRVNLHRGTDEDQLVGSKTLVDGNVEIVEGPLLIAMRTGSVILLDELDAADCNNIMCLQSILEGKPYYFKLKNEIITPAPGFNVIATGNTKGKGSEDGRYIGTNILNEAFLERFAVTFEQEYPSSAVEKKIVKNLMDHYKCVNEEFAELLVKWADAIRKTFDDGGVDETITTRRVGHIIRAYSIFKNESKAIELCCNRFDINTKSAFIDLFEKMKNPTEVNEEQIPF